MAFTPGEFMQVHASRIVVTQVQPQKRTLGAHRQEIGLRVTARLAQVAQPGQVLGRKGHGDGALMAQPIGTAVHGARKDQAEDALAVAQVARRQDARAEGEDVETRLRHIELSLHQSLAIGGNLAQDRDDLETCRPTPGSLLDGQIIDIAFLIGGPGGEHSILGNAQPDGPVRPERRIDPGDGNLSRAAVLPQNPGSVLVADEDAPTITGEYVRQIEAEEVESRSVLVPVLSRTRARPTNAGQLRAEPTLIPRPALVLDQIPWCLRPQGVVGQKPGLALAGLADEAAGHIFSTQSPVPERHIRDVTLEENRVAHLGGVIRSQYER